MNQNPQNKHMNTIKSNKTMADGMKYEVISNAPSVQDWLDKIGADRLANDYNGHKVANNLASALKLSFAIASGESKDEGGKARKHSAERVELANEHVRMVKAGEMFDLRDFVSDGSPRGKMALDNYDAVIAAVMARFTDRAFVTRLSESLGIEGDTAEEMVAAIKATYTPAKKTVAFDLA